MIEGLWTNLVLRLQKVFDFRHNGAVGPWKVKIEEIQHLSSESYEKDDENVTRRIQYKLLQPLVFVELSRETTLKHCEGENNFDLDSVCLCILVFK